MLEETRERAAEQQAERSAQQLSRASAYHRAFVQNEAGKSVLDNWVRMYCMTPITGSDSTLFQCGVAEGKRQMVKEILDHIGFIENRNED